MLSVFGKWIRTFRLERGILLKDMADELGVTSSYLSAVEFGKRNIPREWIEKLAEVYRMNADEFRSMNEAVIDSIFEIKFDLKERNSEDKSLILSFARNLDSMDVQKKKALMNIFNSTEQEA